MFWHTRSFSFDLASGPLVMGIINVTLDSFSDGGKYAETAAAVAHARRLEEEGADILDIGGESTRPGSDPTPAEVEAARVLPVIRALAGTTRCAISIDTSKPAVAAAALEAGAHIINDVRGLREPAMARLAAEAGAGAVIMHMRGEPRTMQDAPVYADLIGEVREFFRQSMDRAITCGMKPEQIALDPGIGFGKTVEHNLELIRRAGELRVADRPLVLGASRKGFMAQVSGAGDIPGRLAPALAAAALARRAGVNIFRVHDVVEHVRALKMTEALLPPPTTS